MLLPEERSNKPPKETDGIWVLLLFVVLLILTGIIAKFTM